MNVNLFGPPLWRLLHGVAGLCPPAVGQHVGALLDALRVLLPCPHCLRSYVVFYEEAAQATGKTPAQHAAEGGAFRWVYDMHARVDDKLEGQKLDAAIAAVDEALGGADAWAAARDALRGAAQRLSHKPAYLVVQKRFALAEGVPFGEDCVWLPLFSFVMAIDRDADPAPRRAGVQAWVSALARALQPVPDYAAVSARLLQLERVWPLLHNVDAKAAFYAVALAREGLLDTVQAQSDVRRVVHAESSWLKPLRKLYLNNLPAGACGSFTCA